MGEAAGKWERRQMSSAASGRARALLPFPGMKLCIFVGVNLGGFAGWEIGDRFGTMTAFLLSGAGSVVGVFAGWWVARRYLA